jgi:hypothetical protein
MPFGLTNAPPCFQRIMTGILRKAIGKFALVYLDDVIIFSKTEEEHIKHIEEIFALIAKSGMKLKLSNCCFFELSVLYPVMCTSYGDLFENLTLRRTLRQFSLFLKFTVTST